MKDLKEKFEKRVEDDPDGVYDWLEEHVIIPNHYEYYDKVEQGSAPYHNWEIMSWFIERLDNADSLWGKLKQFLEQKPLGEKQDWVIEIQLEYYHSLENKGLESDFYKALVYVDMTISEMEDIIAGNEFGRCIRRVIPYEEAKEEYLKRQADNKERQEKWDTLKDFVKANPDAPIVVTVADPLCVITTTTTYVIDILGKLKAFDFMF